jgi:hypothetical protein
LLPCQLPSRVLTMKEKAQKLKVGKLSARTVNRSERQSILGGGSCVLNRRQMLSAAL